MKKTFTATFADGTTKKRTTEHDYAVCWRATWTSVKAPNVMPSEVGRKHEAYGFSSSRENVSAFKPQARSTYRGMSSNDRSIATRANAEYLIACGYHLEIAEAIAQ